MKDSARVVLWSVDEVEYGHCSNAQQNLEFVSAVLQFLSVVLIGCLHWMLIGWILEEFLIPWFSLDGVLDDENGTLPGAFDGWFHLQAAPVKCYS
jgi:hypothetical protein